MAAASADAPYDGHHDSGYLDRKTLPLRTGLHDSEYLFTETKWRCDTLCMQRDPTGETFTPISSLVQVSDLSEFRSASTSMVPLGLVITSCELDPLRSFLPTASFVNSH